MMTPGDVSMLLNETNGLRVQTTSPSLGGANVRIQGLRGRYTQILADGLPLYGGQAGSIGILQIPPMDLGQVEIIKVASALYGVSAIGASSSTWFAPADPDVREVLNQTSHGGTDAILWLAEPLTPAGATRFSAADTGSSGRTSTPTGGRICRCTGASSCGRACSGRTAGCITPDARRGDEGKGGAEAMPGAATPDGSAFPETSKRREWTAGWWLVVFYRAELFWRREPALPTSSTITFGSRGEHDRHRTFFGEASVTGIAGAQTWVGGVAWQGDTYSSRDVPAFDYRYSVPALFGQDDITLNRHVTVSASARLDAHNQYRTFVSPRLSTLIKPGGPWTVRVSAGRGYFAPSPFTEDTEATGLRPVRPLGDLSAERADSLSGDVTWTRRPLEVTGTVFFSRVRDA